MRVISFNANGIRSAARKGFFDWMQSVKPDFVCVQETKAQLAKLDMEILRPEGYELFYTDAVKPGYSGVAIYSKHKPLAVHHELGWDYADNEGRYIQLDFKGFSVASIYLPSGSSGDVRQDVKFDFMKRYEKKLTEMRKQRRKIVICGDWNIVHKEIDIRNWKSNQKNSGCLPEERAWLDKLFDKMGWVDAFREINQEAEQYTWWSNRGQSWAKNVGWRIDYQIVTPNLAKLVKSSNIYKENRFSDHAPLLMDYDLFL